MCLGYSYNDLPTWLAVNTCLFASRRHQQIFCDWNWETISRCPHRKATSNLLQQFFKYNSSNWQRHQCHLLADRFSTTNANLLHLRTASSTDYDPSHGVECFRFYQPWRIVWGSIERENQLRFSTCKFRQSIGIPVCSTVQRHYCWRSAIWMVGINLNFGPLILNSSTLLPREHTYETFVW